MDMKEFYKFHKTENKDRSRNNGGLQDYISR